MNKREVECLFNLLKTEMSSVGTKSMDLSVSKKSGISENASSFRKLL